MPPSPSRRRSPLAALALLPLVPLLGACVASGTAPPSTHTRPHAGPRAGAGTALIPPTRQPERVGPRQAIVHMAPGLEGVIGATPAELTRAFGPARLDVYEGDARKLQFTGRSCVLDVFLYPGARGGEPQATYVEARRLTGAEADRAGCVAELKVRR